MSEFQRTLECNERLAKFGRYREIEGYIIYSPGPLGVTEYMLATAVEAVFGAVFYDCGKAWSTVEQAMVSFGVFKGKHEMTPSWRGGSNLCAVFDDSNEDHSVLRRAIVVFEALND